MSIATQLTSLKTDIDNARAAVVAKGGTVTEGGGSSQLATDIGTITGGTPPKYGASIDGILGDVNGSGALQPPSTNTSLVFTGVQSIPNHRLRYAFYYNPAIVGVSFPNLTSIGSYGLFNAFYSDSQSNGNIVELSMPNLATVATYGLQNAFYNQKLENAVLNLPSLTSVNSSSFNYTFYNSRLGSFSANNLTSVSSTSAFAYAFQNNTNTNFEVHFDKLATIGGSTSFQYAFANSKLFYNKVGHPFPKLQTINGSLAISYAFAYSNAYRIVFDKLLSLAETSSSSYGIFQYAFQNANMGYEVANDYDRRGVFFPSLQTIGKNAAGTNRMFSGMFSGGLNHTLHFYDLTTVYNEGSTASYGQFNQCQAKRIYMPKVTSLGTYNQYCFYNSTSTEEIHFGIENEATITAMSGYASKFGATNATIYFDMVNHIMVDGINYYRDGANCDLDNWYFAWQNPSVPSDIIYTTNFKDPAVGDTTYTKSGTTYTAGGTITAVA